MALTSRDDILARYRHLRQLNLRHHTAALRGVSTPALLAQGKRLGLASGKTFVLDDEDDMTFIFDLTLYTSSTRRTRAIDRYAQKTVHEAGSDDDVLLKAMQQTRFSLWRVERRHETAGLIVRDLIREEELWLIDEGLEASAPIGLCAALRLFQMPNGFAMSCGVSVSLDADMIELIFDQIGHLFDKRREEAAEDRRFAESIYKIALLERKLDEMLWEAA